MTTPDSMRALVLHAVGDARLENIPVRSVEPGCVRVRIGFCGVCGSDIPRVFVKGTYHFPTVCGHEFAGVVDECGEGVDGFKPGDRVAVFPLLWCDRCSACEKGQFVMCEDYDYLGSRSDGAFSEYVIAPQRNLLRVPDSVTMEEAAMTEPAAVALHAVRRGGGTRPGETVVVFGAGPIGVMVAQWARAMGASRVVLFDVIPEKLELAKKLGFELSFDSREKSPVEVVKDLTDSQGAQLVLDAAGVPITLVQSFEVARRGGRVVMLGNPSGAVSVPPELLSQMLRREVSVYGTWNSEYSPTSDDDDWHAVLDAMATKKIDLLPLVTHKVVLEDSFDALKMMRDASEFFSKVLVHP
ncbi:MAG: galactitol-1-phosphate 5-dehydrogenase [Planctomycetota bacterium]